MGSITAPERIWAPTSEPFSSTTTERLGARCVSRIAPQARPGRHRPITTSKSIDSRGTVICIAVGLIAARTILLIIARIVQ